MKLFEVANGWVCNGDVHVLVIAESEEVAKNIAKEVYKKDANDRQKINDWPISYWEDLTVTVLCEDTSKLWTSEVLD